MKHTIFILVLIFLLSLFSSCSKDSNNNNNSDISNIDKKDDITSNKTIENNNNSLLGKWIYVAGQSGIEVSFTEDICSMYYAQYNTHDDYKYTLDNDSFTIYLEDEDRSIEHNYSIINNVLVWNWAMNFKDGEIPNFNNKYSDSLVGYYKSNTFNDYYNFGKNGKLEVIKEWNTEYNYYYVATEDYFHGIIGGQDSEAFTGSKYKIIGDDIELLSNDNSIYDTLLPISKEDFINRQNSGIKQYNPQYELLILKDDLEVKDSPSLSANAVDTTDKYTKLPYSGISKEAEGYTWYKTTNDTWVADKNNEYVYPLKFSDGDKIIDNKPANYLVGKWRSMDYANSTLEFFNDGSFVETSNTDYLPNRKGTYSLSDNSIFYQVDEGYNYSQNFAYINNVLAWDLFARTLYYKEGDYPILENEYTRRLAGYYVSDYGDYYYFDANGKLIITSPNNMEFDYYYTANDELYWISMDRGSSDFNYGYKYKFNNGIIELYETTSASNAPFTTLRSVPKEEFENVRATRSRVLFEKKDSLIILADAIKIRNSPSKNSDKVGVVKKGDMLSFTGQTQSSDGYTWYEITDNKWIADDNGKWVYLLKY